MFFFIHRWKQEEPQSSWCEDREDVSRSSWVTQKTPGRTAFVWSRWLLVYFPWRWNDNYRWYGRNGWFEVKIIYILIKGAFSHVLDHIELEKETYKHAHCYCKVQCISIHPKYSFSSKSGFLYYKPQIVPFHVLAGAVKCELFIGFL